MTPDYTNPHTGPFPLQLALNIDPVLKVFSIHRNLQRAKRLLILNPKTSISTRHTHSPTPHIPALDWAQGDHNPAAAPLLLGGHMYRLCQDSLPEGQMRLLFWEAWEIGGIYIMCVRSHCFHSEQLACLHERPPSQIKSGWKSRYSHQSPSVLLMKPCLPEWMDSDDAALLDGAKDLSAKKKYLVLSSGF